MRILMLNNEFPPLGGGTATANLMLFREWAACEDLELDLITAAAGTSREEAEFSDRIRIIRLPTGIRDAHHAGYRELLTYAWKGGAEAIRRHRAKPYDLAMAWHAVPAGMIARRLYGRFRLPYLIRVGGADIPGFEKRFRWIYPLLTPVLKHIWKPAARLIVKSEGEKNMLQEAASWLEPQIVPNGVDTEWFQPVNPPFTGQVFTICCVARLIERKGQRFLLEALRQLLDQGVDARLVLVGGGDDLLALRGLSARLNVEGKVRFAGDIPREEIAREYQSSHVFAMMSFNEGMSNAMLEAMACGLPVVVSQTPGTRETVTDGVNGFELAYGDVAGLTDRLRRLSEDSALRHRMGSAARARALKFSWRQAADTYHQMFHALV